MFSHLVQAPDVFQTHALAQLRPVVLRPVGAVPLSKERVEAEHPRQHRKLERKGAFVCFTATTTGNEKNGHG